MKLSAVILAKNEKRKIRKSVASVSFCDEILIIDDFSTDETIKSAKSQNPKVKIIQKKLQGDFAGQRNYAMNQVTHDWMLFIDADEEVSSQLKLEIGNLKFNKEAYYLKRRDFWWGRELRFGETQKVRNKGIVRLVRKNSGKWMGNVHEIFYTAKSTGTLDGFINHYPHPTVKEFIEDINMYSTLRAKELLNQGVSSGILHIVFFPFFKFVLNYFIYLGFLDGPAGFAYAFFMSFHSFLVRAKLYQYRISKDTT